MENNIIITQIVEIKKEQNQSWHFPPHSHRDEYEVSFILDGEFIYSFDNYKVPLSKNVVYIKVPGQIHEELSLSPTAGRQIHIVFKFINSSTEFPFDKEYSIFDGQQFADVFNSLFQSILELGKEDFLSKEFLLNILHMINRLSFEQKNIEVQQIQKKDVINAVKKYIDLHYSDELSLTKLSEKFYISPYYLSRKFKETTKSSISEYINSCRIGEAQRLLIFTDIEIKSIVTKCGFKDVHYFYNQFKKSTGLTPIQFKEQYNNQ